MQIDRKIDSQTRAMLMATAVSAIVASAAMFVPAQIWESITGSTGISEMFPAAAAPLGDRARALIAFALGAGCFLLLSAQAFRSPGRPSVATDNELDDAYPHAGQPFAPLEQDAEAGPRPSLVARLREKLASHLQSRRAYADITTLDDLPKLRAGDAHPDAPPRRPFSAGRDLVEETDTDTISEPDIAVSEPVALAADRPVPENVTAVNATAEETSEEGEEAMPLVDDSMEPGLEAELIEAAAAAESGDEDVPIVLSPPAIAAVQAAEPANMIESQPETGHEGADSGIAADAPLSAIVDRLEAALDARDAQLARVEALARELSAASASDAQPVPVEETPPVVAARPVLEAVPDSPSAMPSADEMDPALRSALETLHRMSARSR